MPESDVQTFETSAHTALLDPINGAGILVAPSPSDDLRIGPGASLIEADWNSVIRPLLKAGWLPLTDDWDVPVTLATLPSGRQVHALYPAQLEGKADVESDQPFTAALLALMDHYCDR